MHPKRHPLPRRLMLFLLPVISLTSDELSLRSE
jgi:hypothetical protein